MLLRAAARRSVKDRDGGFGAGSTPCAVPSAVPTSCAVLMRQPSSRPATPLEPLMHMRSSISAVFGSWFSRRPVSAIQESRGVSIGAGLMVGAVVALGDGFEGGLVAFFVAGCR